MKRTIEIEDNLTELVEDCKTELLDAFREYINENPDTENLDNVHELSDRIYEIVDSSTPIYYSDIDGLYYLYGSEFDEAYENAGCGNKSENNYRQAAIYFYLHMETDKFYCELQTWFDDKILELDEEEDEEAHKSALLEAVNDLDSDLI